MTIQIERIPHPDWSVIAQSPDYTIFQSEEWLRFLTGTQSAEPVVLRLSQSGETIGVFVAAMVKKYGMRFLGSPLPGWTTSYMGMNLVNDIDRIEVARAVAQNSFTELGCVHVEMLDRNFTVEQASVAGLRFREFHNSEIDLRRSEDQIFESFKGSCRTSIRTAEKRGVTLESANDELFAEEYYSQLVDVYAKQNLRPSYGLGRVRSLIANMRPTGRLLTVRARSAEGAAIASAIYLSDVRRMYLWGAASWREYQILQPNEAVHWFALRYWRDRGVQFCDMGGGGEYKKKYNGLPFSVPHVRISKYPGLELLRRATVQLQKWRQRT